MRSVLHLIALWPLLTMAQPTPADTLPKPTRQFMNRPVSSISLGLGVSQSAFRNDNESVLIRTGIGVPVSVTYRREGPRVRQYVGVDYISHGLSSRFSNETSELRGTLSYTYLRWIRTGERLTLYAGGVAEMQASLQPISFGLAGSNPTGSLISALSVSGMADYRRGNHGFEAQVSLAVVGFAILPGNSLFSGEEPALGDVLGAFETKTLPRFLGTAWRVSYFPPAVSQRWFWRIDYRGQLQRFNQKPILGFAQQQLMASFIYQFGKRP